MYVRMHVCMFAFMFTFMCMYIYIYIYIEIKKTSEMAGDLFAQSDLAPEARTRGVGARFAS